MCTCNRGCYFRFLAIDLSIDAEFQSNLSSALFFLWIMLKEGIATKENLLNLEIKFPEIIYSAIDHYIKICISKNPCSTYRKCPIFAQGSIKRPALGEKVFISTHARLSAYVFLSALSKLALIWAKGKQGFLWSILEEILKEILRFLWKIYLLHIFCCIYISTFFHKRLVRTSAPTKAFNFK